MSQPTTYLTEAELFPHRPAIWAVWETGEWMHQGHVDKATVNRELAKPLGPQFDAAESVPGTLKHLWMRFAKHDPEYGCDDEWCDCDAADDEDYLWWETVARDAEGAVPVTWVTARSIGAEVA